MLEKIGMAIKFEQRLKMMLNLVLQRLQWNHTKEGDDKRCFCKQFVQSTF